MNQSQLAMSQAERVMQDSELKLIVDSYQATSPFLEPTPINLPIFDDPAKLHVCSSEQALHSTKAEKAGVGYWRNAREKCANDQATGYSKFESCAYLAQPEDKLFETPGMGLELQCLTSFLTQTNRNKILQNYVSKKQSSL